MNQGGKGTGMPHIIIPFIPFINNNNNVNFRPRKTGIYSMQAGATVQEGTV